MRLIYLPFPRPPRSQLVLLPEGYSSKLDVELSPNGLTYIIHRPIGSTVNLLLSVHGRIGWPINDPIWPIFPMNLILKVRSSYLVGRCVRVSESLKVSFSLALTRKAFNSEYLLIT